LLREPKKHLIETIVDDIGHAMAVQIMHETKQVLHKGGMRRVDGNGLRKPGGSRTYTLLVVGCYYIWAVVAVKLGSSSTQWHLQPN